MKNSLLLLRGAGIVLALLLVTSTMKAQSPPCPVDTLILPVGSGYPGWTHISTPLYFIGPGGDCSGTADYCYRVLYNFPPRVWPDTTSPIKTTVQTVLISYSLDSTCNIQDAQAVLNAAADSIFKDAARHLSIYPPCSDTNAYIKGEGYYSSCWKWVQKAPGPNVYRPCKGNYGAYCENRCDICQQSGFKFNCVNISIGTPDCADGAAPKKLSDWVFGACYQVQCGIWVH